MRQIFLLILALISLIGCSSNPKMTPNNEAVNLEAAADTNMKLGMLYLQKGDVQHAQQRFDLALKETPNNPAAWYSMGYFLEVTGENDKAEQYFLHAVKLDPDNGDAKNNYGTFLCHTGRYQDGIKQFQAALETKNYLNTADTYENIGLCAMQIPDYKLAENYLQKSLSQNPNRPEALGALAEVYYQTKDYKAAKDYLARYKKLVPENTSPDIVTLEANLKNIKKSG